MNGKGMAAVLFVAAFGSAAWADEASLQLTFQPKAGGEKTVFVARTQAHDGTVKGETKLEVAVSKNENGEKKVTVSARALATGSEVQGRAERSEHAKKRAGRSARVHVGDDDVNKALAEMQDAMKEADGAMKDADGAMAQADRDMEQAERDVEQARRDVEQARRDMEQAQRDLEGARRDLRAGLESVGFRFEGERTLGREPKTVCELAGVDAKLVVSKSAARREVTVEVGGRSLACTLHTFDVKDGANTRSVAVWVSAEAKGTGLVALRVASKDGSAHEVALEGTKGSLRVLLEKKKD